VNKLNIGVIGLGIGQKHVETFNNHPQCRVRLVCDISKDKCNNFKHQFPRIKITDDASKIINNPDIQLVSIASYDNYHFEQIIASINNNKHVFVEKPLCMNEEEAKKIKLFLREKPNLKLSSNLVLRACPLFIQVRDSIQLGEIGQIFYIEGDYLWGRINKLHDGWRKDMEFYSIINGAAIHIIDLIVWLTGMKPILIQAFGNNLATEGTDLRYNSFVVILLKFENGLIAKVTANGGCVHPHFHGLEIFGTKKTWIHGLSETILINSIESNQEPSIINGKYPAKKERCEIINSFVDSILDQNVQPIVPAKDVFDIMSICFTAEKAMNNSTIEKIKYA